MANRLECSVSAPLWISLFFFGWHSSACSDDAIQVVPIERWSNVFAESETRWHYRISSELPVRKRAVWRLTMNQRTAASGELEVRADTDKPTEHSITLRWPKVKEGSVQGAQLMVSIGEVKHDRPVWIFPRDSLTDRRDWLRSLKLSVFDPPGNTIEVLNDSDIPHERIRSRDSLDGVSEGIVIVGEGVSLRKNNGLMNDLRALTIRGVPVLCLASDEGSFPFSDDQNLVTALELRRADVIRDLDKRLDTLWWPKGSSQLRGLQIDSASDKVVAEIHDNAKSWPWCEWQFGNDSLTSEKSSRLIWCGFGIIHSWDDGPTPRYLLAKILERLSPAP